MAKIDELTNMLEKRFKDVPNVKRDDVEGWIERSMLEHSYRLDSDVPDNMVVLLLLYAEWDAALQIALKTAYYFEYKDAEESVDKRNVSEQYRRIAAELRKKYDRKKLDSEVSSGGSQFHLAPRVDR